MVSEKNFRSIYVVDLNKHMYAFFFYIKESIHYVDIQFKYSTY